MIRVYLDNCCFSRPFDDKEQSRVRLESQAIIVILGYVTDGSWTMVGSDAVDQEVGAIRDPGRRHSVQEMVAAATEHVSLNSDVTRRGEHLQTMGFRGYDAFHIACAEAGGADVLLTTDDAFMRRAQRVQHELSVRVANPVTWLKEGHE